jgi:hypothetical protein
LAAIIRFAAFAGGKEGPAHIDVEGRVERLDRQVQRQAVSADAGVVHQNPDWAELRLGLVEGGADAAGVGDVEGNGRRSRPQRSDFSGEGLDAIRPTRRDRHGRPMPGKQACEVRAQPAARAGHENNLARQVNLRHPSVVAGQHLWMPSCARALGVA